MLRAFALTGGFITAVMILRIPFTLLFVKLIIRCLRFLFKVTTCETKTNHPDTEKANDQNTEKEPVQTSLYRFAADEEKLHSRVLWRPRAADTSGIIPSGN